MDKVDVKQKKPKYLIFKNIIYLKGIYDRLLLKCYTVLKIMDLFL